MNTMNRFCHSHVLFLLATGLASACGGSSSFDLEPSDIPRAQATFQVRVENVSTPATLQPSVGDSQAVPLSPGVWVVHGNSDALFSVGAPDRGLGLEAIAEDGNPSSLAGALASGDDIVASAAMNTPEGADGPGPLVPGGAYTFEFTAESGDRLSLATMFVPSNDVFFAPAADGIPLFENGQPISGDVTSAFRLWDAGTEINEEPGLGPNQVQRQAAANTGPAESSPVQLVDDGFSYPPVASVLRVTVTAQ